MDFVSGVSSEPGPLRITASGSPLAECRVIYATLADGANRVSLRTRLHTWAESFVIDPRSATNEISRTNFVFSFALVKCSMASFKSGQKWASSFVSWLLYEIALHQFGLGDSNHLHVSKPSGLRKREDAGHLDFRLRSQDNL
jgi:hypothetical protein